MSWPRCSASLVGWHVLTTAVSAAVWTAGHGDLSLRYTASPQPQFSYGWTVGTGGDPASVDDAEVYDATFSASALTPQTGPAVVASPAPLLTGGSPLHVLPQDGTDAAILGAPFQGWSTGMVPGGLFTGNQVRLRLTAVNGPGNVALWSDNGFGGTTFLWASANGFTAADILPLSVGGHSHFNISFSAPGTYQLSVQAEATLSAGGSVSTPLAISYRVIPEPSTGLCLIAAALPLLRHRSRRFPSP